MPANMGLERVAHDQVHLHAKETREVVLQGDEPEERGGLDEEHGRAMGRSGRAHKLTPPDASTRLEAMAEPG